MRRMIFLMMLVTTFCCFSQVDVTKFLGIPIDGSKDEMVQKLIKKGFAYDPNGGDNLYGEFNGRNVKIGIVTNKNKVYRIVVSDVYPDTERGIINRFNALCSQFENSGRYHKVSAERIPEGENIYYEITVNHKSYDAAFFQLPDEETGDELEAAAKIELKKMYPTMSPDTLDIKANTLALSRMLGNTPNKIVWFTIFEYMGSLDLVLYYDNKLNQPNGEDL